MTNQTIDGVLGLRSLLERVTSQSLGMSAKKDRAEAAHELRALLDSPIRTPLLGGGVLEEQPEWAQIQILKNTVADLQGDIEKLQAELAAKPQGDGITDDTAAIQAALETKPKSQGEPVGIQVGTSLRGQSFIRNCQVTCCGSCPGGCTTGSKP